jgi:hypothetical protein
MASSLESKGAGTRNLKIGRREENKRCVLARKEEKKRCLWEEREGTN